MFTLYNLALISIYLHRSKYINKHQLQLYPLKFDIHKQ
jgi:hypothetical protein